MNPTLISDNAAYGETAVVWLLVLAGLAGIALRGRRRPPAAAPFATLPPPLLTGPPERRSPDMAPMMDDPGPVVPGFAQRIIRIEQDPMTSSVVPALTAGRVGSGAMPYRGPIPVQREFGCSFCRDKGIATMNGCIGCGRRHP